MVRRVLKNPEIPDKQRQVVVIDLLAFSLADHPCCLFSRKRKTIPSSRTQIGANEKKCDIYNKITDTFVVTGTNALEHLNC